MNNPCELQAVVVGSDPAVIDSIILCLEQLGIVGVVYAQAASAIEALARQKVDAFFVDGDLDPELSVLKGMRSSPSSRGAVAFAIVPKQKSVSEASRVADFVMDKPLAPLSLNRAVRAAYGIMLKERRRYFRHVLRIPVEVTDATYRKFVGHTINLSQTGMAMECAAPLAAGETVQLDFHGPDTGNKLNCKSQIIWTAEQGKAGLTFTQMKSSDKERLTDWIESEFHRLWEMPSAKVPAVASASRLAR
jgi:CheY-like chemotaxis protein